MVLKHRLDHTIWPGELKTVHQNSFLNLQNWHIWKTQWTVRTTVEPPRFKNRGLFFLVFSFLFLLAQPLLKLQPQTLRSHQHFFVFFFSVSFTPSLSAFLPTAVFAFSLSLHCFCLLFLHFPLILCFFPLHSRVFWSTLKMIGNLHSVTH